MFNIIHVIIIIVIGMKKRNIILTILFLLLDIISKLLIDRYIVLDKSIKIINDFFYITKVYNEGASWSILWGLRIILIIISVIVLGILFIYQKKFVDNKRNTLAFSLLYAGIIGNLLNRVIYGYVIDFIDFKILSYDYPVFNIADICIVFGILLLIIAIIKKEDENETSSR